ASPMHFIKTPNNLLRAAFFVGLWSVLFGLTGCGGGSSGAKTPSANNTSLTSVSSASSSVIVDSSSSDSFRDNLPVTIAPDDSAIRYSGRVSLTATAALYDWANIQIEFRVN